MALAPAAIPEHIINAHIKTDLTCHTYDSRKPDGEATKQCVTPPRAVKSVRPGLESRLPHFSTSYFPLWSLTGGGLFFSSGAIHI